ncbi:uncharacterized protein LOC108623921 isoform X2 [Ceratina calcarata]|uniref:Uncharacterized protein LOC108623921 isoform X2 n=1 Tax=Ceratina calcarata TaxID=156304 RepID=A0AAJ7IVK1_9HYME|nr:uncharacterized protein LOC108623921 isoform X2 [Ceratina calcarata]
MSKNRKRKREGENQFTVDWEKEHIFPDEIINEMESMWEIPQILHFLHLARESLNIPHLSMYEMERMLLIPRASKQLANIMTSLLSSPMTKAKLRKVPPMPYEFWTNILAYKMKSWFKIYEAKHQDPVKVLEAIGVEPEFWSIFPDAPLLNGKDFEDLSFRRRAWLLKTVCDTVMHTRKTVQEEVMNQPWEDQFETVLGTDRYGARYIYFPQFLKSDLRIYKHSFDNNVLLTVKPIKQKLKTESEDKSLDQTDLLRKKGKCRKRKWCNGKTPKSKKRTSKCNSDSATGSLINEDTNLSNTSVCSSSNSNNLTLNTVIDERSRSLSKSSARSTESEKRHYKCTSGYESSSSVCIISGKRTSQKMFKGFSDSCDSKCKIKIIHGLLDDIKRDTSEEKDLRDIDVTSSHTSKIALELTDTKSQYLDETSLCTKKNDTTVSNLSSSSSKTDDEKLNEIFSAENFKSNDKNSSNVQDVKDTLQISTRLKSDDERLNEPRTVHREEEGRLVPKQELDKLSERSNTDSFDEVSLNELRSILQKEAMDDESSFDEDDELKYNCRNIKDQKRRKAKDFNNMLMELSSSKFQLVADSVNSLRDLIASFEQRNINLVSDTNGESELPQSNETKLVEKLKELLSSLEEIEPVLRESAKKARAKLHKEWINYNEGAEDQDSSGEGLGSNWWVLGSQGCLLSASGDALQTLSQPTLSATSSQKDYIKTEKESFNETANDSKIVNGECKKSQDDSLENGSQKEQCKRSEGNDEKNARTKEETKEETSDNEQQTRRVLRTRGISSYTEQLFYSDEETEENELEGWTDVEAVYAASDPYANTSSSHPAAKDRLSDDGSNEEDSDKDWILPGSRKRKNKRPSTARRLKAFKQKLQNITTNVSQNTAESEVKRTSNEREKPKVTEIRICRPKNPNDPKVASSSSNSGNSVQEIVQNIVENTVQTVQTTVQDTVQNTVQYTVQNEEMTQSDQETVPSVETITSVHSELDIKDEGPIYDSMTCHFDQNYTAFNPNYVNYYVIEPTVPAVMPQTAIVQASPVVSNIVQPIQQGYYVQGDQNYIIQSPQPGFVGPQSFEPQSPQMIQPPQFVNPTGFIPYMIAQPQPEYVTTNQQTVPPSLPQNYNLQIRANSTPIAKPQKLKKFVFVKENQPNSVIRYTSAAKVSGPRTNNTVNTRNVMQQTNISVKAQKAKEPNTSAGNTDQKTTSLIVLSDSDDEIEMISTEKISPPSKPATSPLKYIVPAPRKNVIPQQIIQRMNQGGISITPIKPPTPVQNATTQLVVVLNESGSHYALALPNGSKLILTPEQVAQIRASNGGKLIL